MDMQTPDQPLPYSTNFAEILEAGLAASIPVNPADTPEERARKLAAAQEEFASFQPSNAADARLAAFAVAGALGAMDSLERASRPGVGGETAGRLRGNVLSAARFYAATLASMRKRNQQQAQAAARRQDAQDDAQQREIIPIPRIEVFQPRDRRGKPIPRWRNDLMSRKQILAAYDFANKAAWAEATAEEDAAITEQAELDAKSPPTEEELAEIFPLTPRKGPPPGGILTPSRHGPPAT